MAFSLSPSDVDRIASVLGVEPKRDGSLLRFELADPDTGRQITMEILLDLSMPEGLGDESKVLVSVYAASSFLQLQNCTGFLASQELGEVIFFAKRGGSTSGLVIEREAACSLYAHVEDRLLSADFTQLPPELVMSSVALSMTEDLFDNLG